MKLFVGVAPYDGKIFASTATALMGEQDAARAEGVQFGVLILSGAHYVAESYNILLARFIKSDFDKFATVEWDVSWGGSEQSPFGQLLDLARHPHAYLAGSTRMKYEPEEYMVGFDHTLPGRPEERADKYGCIPCNWVPQGFSVMSREAAHALWEDAAGREYIQHGERIRQVFREDYRPEIGQRFGQDIGICWDLKRLGFDVHVHPDVHLTHHAAHGHAYPGRLADWMAKQPDDWVERTYATFVARHSEKAA